jgi:hypothetical protein
MFGSTLEVRPAAGGRIGGLVEGADLEEIGITRNAPSRFRTSLHRKAQGIGAEWPPAN